MEKSEALLYLPVGEDEAVEDVYEQKVFEWKNFFVNRFPISKLFGKKLEQLAKLDQAYETLGGVVYSSIPEDEADITFDVNLKTSFLQYSQQRNQLKVQLFAASSAKDVVIVVSRLLRVTKAFAKVWTSSELDAAGVVVSKELDPMDLLQAIEDAITIGVDTITEIGKLPEDHLVLNEAKRLSLWSKMEADE